MFCNLGKQIIGEALQKLYKKSCLLSGADYVFGLLGILFRFPAVRKGMDVLFCCYSYRAKFFAEQLECLCNLYLSVIYFRKLLFFSSLIYRANCKVVFF